MRRLINGILNLIYPERARCSLCKDELISWEIQLGICHQCLNEMNFFAGKGLKKLPELFEQHIDLVGSAVLYTGLIKELIYRLKYYGERQLIYPMVELMVRQYYIIFKEEKWDGLIPVPLHESRLHERGYNQALLLAVGLSFYLKIPCFDWVERVKETHPQNQLTLDQRRKNLEGAFRLKKGIEIKGGRWLIIDDIFTTGNTTNEIAKILKEAGAEKVGVYTLASGRMM
ncbi:hypothetical protein BBF96_10815 [Anoxybacter fermentans]|uniref:Phosphoribosyltransferase domain-containing protein n=1 Tax=Anoxybacter fermentans TaxID=1323375 RepID=A0A3S9SZU9_9FIRM|nr:ComF family protein [Anoxybacter fermentans]AZR73834.1 hypothetical protein BBF96_10815 [Anoxybacter fermentans]